MLSGEEQYLKLCEKVLTNGAFVGDRTGTGCYSLIGEVLRFDLSKGFPLYTTKKINPELPIGELLWMLSGNTSLPSLREYQGKGEGSHTIWSDDYKKFEETGYGRYENLGKVYGSQLRRYSAMSSGESIKHDQLTTLIDNIKAVKQDSTHPMARRLICSWWNPFDHTIGDKVSCALPACHTDFQCIVREGRLDLRFSMRSNDLFLGNPFNVCFYATLCHILAKLTGLKVGELIYFGTDAHIYANHKPQILLQLTRAIRPMPELILPEFEDLDSLLKLKGKDFKVVGYDPHPFISAPQAS